MIYPERDIILEATVHKTRSLASVILDVRALIKTYETLFNIDNLAIRFPSFKQSYRGFQNKVSHFLFIDGDELETARSQPIECAEKFFASFKDYLADYMVSREHFDRLKSSFCQLQRARRNGKPLLCFRHCIPVPSPISGRPITYRIVTHEYPVDVIRQALFKKYVERYITRDAEDLDRRYGKVRSVTLDKALNNRCRQQVYYAFTRGATIDTDGVVTYPVKVDGKLTLRTSPLSEIFFELRYLSCSDNDHRIPFLQNAMRRVTMYKAGLKLLRNA